MKKSELVSVFYWSIYYFHMPLFIAIPGYCSKADSTAPDQISLTSLLFAPRATQRSSTALAASAGSPSIPTPVPKEERSRVL